MQVKGDMQEAVAAAEAGDAAAESVKISAWPSDGLFAAVDMRCNATCNSVNDSFDVCCRAGGRCSG